MRGVHLVILSGNNSLVSDARPLEQPTGGRETHTHTDMEQALQKYFIIVEKKENVAMRIVLAAYWLPRQPTSCSCSGFMKQLARLMLFFFFFFFFFFY